MKNRYSSYLDAIALKLFAKLSRQALATSIEINGRAFKAPIISSCSCGFSEPWMADVLSILLPDCQGAVLDNRANIGQTLVKVKAVNTNKAYIGVEPSSFSVYYLQKLIEANSFVDVAVIPVALHTENTIKKLIHFELNDADSCASIVPGFREDSASTSSQYVATANWETICATLQNKEIGLIKIDIEGGELEALESLLDAVQSARPPILLEILPAYQVSNAFRVERQNKIEQLLRDLDYQLYRIAKTQEDRFKHLLRIEAIGIHSDLSLCDYAALPRDKEFSILNTMSGRSEVLEV